MRFVIVGGDAAGMSAASRVKRNDPSMEVMVLEKTDDVSYSACGMPYNIADKERPIDDLVVRDAETFRQKQGINLLTGHEVQSINKSDKTVTGEKSNGEPFTFQYDKLLIATGAFAIVPDVQGAKLPGVFALKSLEDGRRIKSYLDQNPVKKATIIGMGYIALEMSEALKQRGLEVEMVKPRPRFLPWLNENLADVILQELEKQNITLRLGFSAEAIEEIKGSKFSLQLLGNGEKLETDLILAAIGVNPNSGLAGDAGLELGPNQAIAVDRFMKTSDDDIYAAGDCADSYHVISDQKVYVPLALRANRGGWAVADNVCGKQIEVPGILGTSVFKVFDLEVARTGFNSEEAQQNGIDPVEVYIKTRSKAHAHPWSSTIHISMVAEKKSGRLLGVQMVGHEGVAHRINSVACALHTRMTVGDFSQMDLAYAPPFSPVWDPLLTAANQLYKKIRL